MTRKELELRLETEIRYENARAQLIPDLSPETASKLALALADLLWPAVTQLDLSARSYHHEQHRMAGLGEFESCTSPVCVAARQALARITERPRT